MHGAEKLDTLEAVFNECFRALMQQYPLPHDIIQTELQSAFSIRRPFFASKGKTSFAPNVRELFPCGTQHRIPRRQSRNPRPQHQRQRNHPNIPSNARWPVAECICSRINTWRWIYSHSPIGLRLNPECFSHITLMTSLRNRITCIPLPVAGEAVSQPKRQRTGESTAWNLVLRDEPFNQVWNPVYACEQRCGIELFDRAARQIDRLTLTFHAFPEWTRDASPQATKMVQPKDTYFPPGEERSYRWLSCKPTT